MGSRSIDGWQLVDGKPSAVLTLPDDLVAGFQSLSVLCVAQSPTVYELAGMGCGRPMTSDH